MQVRYIHDPLESQTQPPGPSQDKQADILPPSWTLAAAYPHIVFKHLILTPFYSYAMAISRSYAPQYLILRLFFYLFLYLVIIIEAKGAGEKRKQKS